MNYKTLTQELWQHVENDKTKQGQKVYNVLNRDLLNDVILNGDVFWIETTSQIFSIPNYAYNYIIKWGEKLGYTYIYNLNKN